MHCRIGVIPDAITFCQTLECLNRARRPYSQTGVMYHEKAHKALVFVTRYTSRDSSNKAQELILPQPKGQAGMIKLGCDTERLDPHRAESIIQSPANEFLSSGTALGDETIMHALDIGLVTLEDRRSNDGSLPTNDPR